MASTTATLDGSAQSWADLIVTAAPYGGGLIDVEDISDISCKRSVEVGEQRRTGGQLIATTTGQAKYEAKGTWYASGYEKMMDALATQAIQMGFVDPSGAARISLVRFDILIQHTVMGATDIRKKEILGCRILEDEYSGSEGTDADKIAVNLHAMSIVYTVKGKKVVLL